jgi:hypothetical protein
LERKIPRNKYQEPNLPTGRQACPPWRIKIQNFKFEAGISKSEEIHDKLKNQKSTNQRSAITHFLICAGGSLPIVAML